MGSVHVNIFIIIIIISLLLALDFETPAAHSGLWHPAVPVGAGDFLPLVFLSDKVNPQVRWTLRKASTTLQSKHGQHSFTG